LTAHPETDSPESTVEALSHLAFYALVALALARQEGAAGTPWAENLFLTRWLATAQKQKRFPRYCPLTRAWSQSRPGRQPASEIRLPVVRLQRRYHCPVRFVPADLGHGYGVLRRNPRKFRHQI
jgi:hypothetical protein